MKKKETLLTTLLALTVLFAVCSLTQAAEQESTRVEATATPEPPPHEHLTGEWLNWFHNPTDWLEMGADLRFRMTWGKNIDSLNDNPTTPDGHSRENHWNFNRYRMRWWQKVKLSDDVDFNTRLVWEFRTWDEGPAAGAEHRDKDTDFDEILFDRFNITLRNLFDGNWTAVIGRQDLIFGTGWLILEGTPLDDSRTICFDALRLTYNWEEKDTRIDMIYIDQGAAEDRWLKPINDRDRYFTEQDERGAILYVTNTSLENTQLEGYFIYKNDNPVNASSSDEPVPWPSSVWSKKAEIYTFGGAVQHKFDDNWSGRVEAAVQTGKKELPSRVREADLEAYGMVSNLTYAFNDERDNSLHVGYEFLSGDDPDTRDIEQFDPLWGEWARWSELYVYTYNLETMIAEVTNLHRLNVGHSFKPWPKWQVDTDYHLLWADENTSATSQYTYPWYSPTLQTSNHSDFRGQLLTCWVKWSCCKQLSWHWLTEYFIPGSYYDQSNRAGALFLRFNIEYTF